MQVEQAIRRVNRDMILGWTVHILLGLGVLVALLGGAAMGVSPVLLAGIPCTLWVLLAINGMRETRDALRWPSLIAAGRLDEAQKQIEQAIGRFGVLRSVKLLSLHQLAVVKAAQRQYRDALDLSRAILQYRLPKDQAMRRASLLLLAGSAVECEQYTEAFAAMTRLRSMPLALDEQLSLLVAETNYMGRLGAWNEMAVSLSEKAKLAELMPTETSAQVQAWLALAARKTGNVQWEQYLVRRCGLLVEPSKLCDGVPVFRELWAGETGNAPTPGVQVR